ncbi:MAG: ASKHA domain-containing protein [Anaerolineales bacterium]|jgi:uncharacterized 2Fe-2S/4Fe-4S cluster protein (DUF4445 family)|nr:ASKHA domain-containing protein [Anaerolineales bacterium]
MYEIDFEPIGRRGSFEPELTLLDCAQQLGVELISICGGSGTCERCKIQVLEGQVSQLTEAEKAALTSLEISQSFHLACQATPLSDLRLCVPTESLSAPGRTQVEGMEVPVEVDPPVRGFDITVQPPSLASPLDDASSFWNAADSQGIQPGRLDLGALQNLPVLLRQHDQKITAVMRGNEIIGVGSPGTRWLGLAVDVGTTKLASYLVDLASGKTLAAIGRMNPQISYGDDIISRIAYTNRSPDHGFHLQRILIEELNNLAADLCSKIGVTTSSIAEIVVTGNTVMHHLLLRLPVGQLGASPYAPVTVQAIDVKARDLGLAAAAGAYVHALPNIAAYVGGDHVAMLLATRLSELTGAVLAIDIGTNTEICLNYQGQLTSVSCASGPAFEGAHIRHGMRAGPGAIEHVRITGEQVEIQTIGGQMPAGICGSGLLDAIAQMRIHGILERRGKLSSRPGVRYPKGQAEFILAERAGLEPITISQGDVRELQLAKAAIRAGIQSLVSAKGISESDLEQVIIAGAFGTYIDIQSAMTIGMLPQLPIGRFRQVGNAAGTGARLALISIKERALAQQIAAKVSYLELAKVPGFSRVFANAMYL